MGTGGDPAAFPSDYRSTYVEVRSCRASADHDLERIRILVEPAALAAYQDRNVPFPDGAVVLKEQYETADVNCTGAIAQWTVMTRLPKNSAPSTIDWKWQRVDRDGVVQGKDEPRCISCHTACGRSPDGYEGTCAAP